MSWESRLAQKLMRSQSGETKVASSTLNSELQRHQKEARTAPLHERTSENEQFEVEEGLLYRAGIAD